MVPGIYQSEDHLQHEEIGRVQVPSHLAMDVGQGIGRGCLDWQGDHHRSRRYPQGGRH